eukprot:Opistho-2@9764
MPSINKGEVLFEADYPLYGVVALGPHTIAIGGGGGRSKTGVPNVLEIVRGPFAETDETRTLSSDAGVDVICRFDPGDRAIMNMSLHPRKDHISCGQDEFCRLMKVEVGKKTATVRQVASQETDFDKEGGFQKFSRFDKEGERLIVGGAEGKLRVMKHPSLKVLVTIDAHKGDVNDADFHPKGTQIASVGLDKKVIVWRISDGKQVCTIDHSKAIPNALQYKLQSCRW